MATVLLLVIESSVACQSFAFMTVGGVMAKYKHLVLQSVGSGLAWLVQFSMLFIGAKMKATVYSLSVLLFEF